MIDNEIIKKAIEEIESKSWGVTEQFFKIHEVVFENDKPTVARIDNDKDDGTVILYFPVKNEKFYLAIYLNTEPEVLVSGVGMEPNNSVYFRASSDTYDLFQLSGMTKLKSTGGRNKGDKKGKGTVLWNQSTIFFEPNPEPDEFEDKLQKLLGYLEQDKEGILSLVEKAGGYIQVAIEFHNGNTMLGGPHISKESIKRMSSLNLEIDFDLYANGKFFK